MMELYGEFRECVLRQRRTFLSKGALEFLNIFDTILENKIVEMKEGKPLWRAQLGAKYEGALNEKIRKPSGVYGRERMFPKKYAAKEGRLNPKGISYLYLAASEKIAISEVRPSIGSYVSCSQMKLTQAVKLVNCNGVPFPVTNEGETPNLKSHDRAWFRVYQAFSVPIPESEDFSEYALTQILAEKFKDMGYDGVIYRSIFSTSNADEDLNVALFDTGKVEMIETKLFEVTGVSVDYKKSIGTYDPETGKLISAKIE